MKLPILFAFTFLITLQLVSSTSSHQPIRGKWVFSRLLEFNNSACCAYSNLTLDSDPSSNRDDLFATFVFDSRFTNNCQRIFGNYINGYQVSNQGTRGYSTTKYIPTGDTYSNYVTGTYEISRADESENTLTVNVDVTDRNKFPSFIDCRYVMTRVKEEEKESGPAFIFLFGSMAKWKVVFGILVLLACVGLVCSKTQYKTNEMAVQGGIQSYQNPQQYYQQPQREVYDNQQRNVY